MAAGGSTASRWATSERGSRRRRAAGTVLVLGLVAAGFAAFGGLAYDSRLHRVDIPVLVLPACWTAATVLYGVLALTLFRHRARVWVPAVAGLALLASAGWMLSMLVHVFAEDGAEDGTEVVATEVSPDGRHELVAESYRNVIDPSCRVWLRERGGTFSRQDLVWRKIEASCPERMEFAQGHTIRIFEGDGAGNGTVGSPRTTTFDPESMRVTRELGQQFD